jgi:molecular chaperone GrpE
LQNTERRANEEIKKEKRFAIERFSGDLLPVMDALEQGLSYTENGGVMIDNLVEGMKLTHHALSNILEKYGITTIDPLGKPFDPVYHEALTMQETKEMKPNHVLQVVQKGYLLNERLLRPARVIVSKAPT